MQAEGGNREVWRVDDDRWANRRRSRGCASNTATGARSTGTQRELYMQGCSWLNRPGLCGLRGGLRFALVQQPVHCKHASCRAAKQGWCAGGSAGDAGGCGESQRRVDNQSALQTGGGMSIVSEVAQQNMHKL